MTSKGHGGAPIDEVGGMGIIAIGMALGSPALDHNVFSAQPQVITTVSAPKECEPDEQLPKDGGLVRTKSKKWGFLGRSKSMRAKFADRSQVQHPSLPLQATVTRTISNTVSSRETPSDSLQDAPSSPPRRPIERSLTEPASSRRRRRPPPVNPPPAYPPLANSPLDKPSSAHLSPAHSSSAHPSPAYLSPAQPSPAHPSPAHPSPAYSSPAYLSPAHSSPAQLSPAQLSPANAPPAIPSYESFQNHTRHPQTSRKPPEKPSREALLDVEIPDITLERYSVMFASLLDRRGTASLLSRRQNTHDKIQALKEEDGEDSALQPEVAVPQRKSSFDGNSPSLLPLRLGSGQSSSKTSPNPSPALTRHSNDAVSDVEKPNSETEKPPAPHIVRLASVRGRNPKVPLTIQKSEDGRPQLRSKFHIPSPKYDSIASRPKLLFDDVVDESARQQAPSRSPSRRNGLNALTESDNASPAPRHQRPRLSNYTHTSGGHSSSNVSQASLSELSEEETLEVEAGVVEDAVQVSIARQISVSRDQRHLLGPLRMHPVNGKFAVETTNSTPRLIDAKKDTLAPLAKFRKNERVRPMVR
ncbi:hypothetical protein E4U13_003482 [Claviceps humidiphila]|uniref:Uncharacterized protein n=1 Tax=Claviceps humidiphila TaxID=1294629 RepID=A0A9P7PZJ7_9HYPO|nr:hypothetical protein E4U13_003482 [Claviceps humidiphila]